MDNGYSVFYQSERTPLLQLQQQQQQVGGSSAIGNPSYPYLRTRTRRLLIRRAWNRLLMELRGRYHRLPGMNHAHKKTIKARGFVAVDAKEDVRWARMLSQCSSPYFNHTENSHDMAIRAIESGGLAIF